MWDDEQLNDALAIAADADRQAALAALADAHDVERRRRVLSSMIASAASMWARVEHYGDHLSRVEDETQEKTRPLVARARELERVIADAALEFVPAGTKTLDLPGLGSISYTDRKATVRITDHDALIESADEHGYFADLLETVEVRQWKDKKAALPAVKAFEEEMRKAKGITQMLPGVEEVEAKTTSQIKYGAAS